MVREPDATMQPTPQDNQLMSKHRVLRFKPQLRLEWRAQDGKSETEQPDHSTSLGDSITSSTQIGFSVHTGDRNAGRNAWGRWDARRSAQSRAFYSSVTACRASKLALRSQIKHGMMFVI
jgi:hypothetical protein